MLDLCYLGKSWLCEHVTKSNHKITATLFSVHNIIFYKIEEAWKKKRWLTSGFVKNKKNNNLILATESQLQFEKTQFHCLKRHRFE